MTKPIMCLSVRQPWAWLIVNGHKRVENRTWHGPYLGPLLIHAGKGMTHAEYYECSLFAHARGVEIPSMINLLRGGIVGMAYLTDYVSVSSDPWFVGPVGWVLEDVKPVTFIPCGGQLGLFEVSATVLDMVTKEVSAV